MNDANANLRLAGYAALIVAATGSMLGHILSVSDDAWGTPFLSANDRSRWCTVRSLVEEGTYAIDNVTADPGWHTIDKVWHRGPDGKFHFYSSKPPLLSTVVAGGYWLIYQCTGATLYDHPYYVGRLLLVATNLLPMVLLLVLLARQIEQYGTTDFGRLVAMAGAAFGTFLTTFVVTLNNHLPGAVCLAILIAAAIPLWYDQCRHPLRYVVAGLAAGLLVACELPALALVVALTVALLVRTPGLTVAAYLPGVAVVFAAILGTNYAAHGMLLPAYSQRGDGPEIARLQDAPTADLDRAILPPELETAIERAIDKPISSSSRIVVQQAHARWELRDEEHARRWALVQEEGGLSVREWANWYDYDGSYWAQDRAVGVDRGEPNAARYAWHVLVGHHGIFTLTPLWILSVFGGAMFLFDREGKLREVTLLTLGVTMVCLAFYLFVLPARDRNYGGITCGFRWVFWLAPLWILMAVPALDWLSQDRWRQALALLALGLSCFSAGFSTDNPWRHPWPYQFGEYMGWGAASDSPQR